MLDYWEVGDSVFVVLEYCPQGDLSQVLQREGRFSEPTAAYYMRQLLSALACVHDVPAVHRDVKPDNLLVTARWVLKLTDFGWAPPGSRHGTRTRLRKSARAGCSRRSGSSTSTAS